MDVAVMTAPRSLGGIESLNHEDFETASIRSTAPSYISEAPSYHTTVSNSSEPIPPYSPRERNSAAAPPHLPASSFIDNSTAPVTASSAAAATHRPVTARAPTLPPLNPNDAPSRGLPPIPPARPLLGLPNLTEFRIPSWSSVAANPNARHYHSVAHRRAAAAESTTNSLDAVKRLVLDRIVEEEDMARNSGSSSRIRPLEDPYLVGEDAARRAREGRLARETGDDVLIREDRRWDWFLGTSSSSSSTASATAASGRLGGVGCDVSFAIPARLPSRYHPPLNPFVASSLAARTRA